MRLPRIIGLVIGGILAVTSLIGPVAPAEARAATSTHCGITAVWGVSITRKLSKNVSLTFRGADLGATTLVCLVAKRKTVAKNSYLSMAFDGHPGKYTAGKSMQRKLTIARGDVGTVVLRLFTKKNGTTKTTWTSKKQYFG